MGTRAWAKGEAGVSEGGAGSEPPAEAQEPIWKGGINKWEAEEDDSRSSGQTGPRAGWAPITQPPPGKGKGGHRLCPRLIKALACDGGGQGPRWGAGMGQRGDAAGARGGWSSELGVFWAGRAAGIDGEPRGPHTPGRPILQP